MSNRGQLSTKQDKWSKKTISLFISTLNSWNLPRFNRFSGFCGDSVKRFKCFPFERRFLCLSIFMLFSHECFDRFTRNIFCIKHCKAMIWISYLGIYMRIYKSCHIAGYWKYLGMWGCGSRTPYCVTMVKYFLIIRSSLTAVSMILSIWYEWLKVCSDRNLPIKNNIFATSNYRKSLSQVDSISSHFYLQHAKNVDHSSLRFQLDITDITWHDVYLRSV